MTDIQEKYLAALQVVDNKKSLLQKKMALEEKRRNALLAKGVDLTRPYDYKGELGDAVYDWKSVADQIKDIEKAIVEKQRIADNWLVKLEKVKAKTKLLNEVPQVFKDLEAELIKTWNDYDYLKLARYRSEYKELGYNGFITKYGPSEYMFLQKTEAQIDKDNRRDAKDIILNLYTRVIDITGDVTDWAHLYPTQGSNGFTVLNGLVTGVNGTAKVESIVAGGYNIQRLHIRVLVHRVGG